MLKPPPTTTATRRAPLPIRGVPIIGFVGDDGAVTITDPAWRPAPQSGPAKILTFPNDPREA